MLCVTSEAWSRRAQKQRHMDSAIFLFVHVKPVDLETGKLLQVLGGRLCLERKVAEMAAGLETIKKMADPKSVLRS